MASSRTFTTSPLMFESDDEDTTNYFDEPAIKSKIKDGKEKVAESAVSVAVDVAKKEERLLKGFQTVLMGIPPPPAFTVPQLDVREILMLWRDNQKYRVILSPGKVRKDEAVASENKVKSTKWPEALGVDDWDIYYNRSSACEEMERLSMRYKDRYVGAETSSCVNALFAKSPSRTASARKRARTRAWGHSPGRRLSHLARRRKAFSYCSVAGNNNPDKKMIMVEIKKISNRQKKRNSAKKTKPTPKKKCQLQPNTHKRALFQSPDQLPAASEAQTPNTQCIQRSKRNLFIETSSDKINENGKRERTVGRKVSPRKRVNRSLSFQDNTPQATDQREVPVPSSTTAQALQTILSGAHKQKMLWAVTNALREETMGMSHELFRPCMSVLFKACQKLWLTKVARLAQEGSTSENMLSLAKQFTTYTINQISQDPTAEHMAMVCGNIIKLAERQSRSEAGTSSADKHIVLDENTRDELRSMKSSPIRPHDGSELPECDDKACSFKEDLVCCTSTDNTSSPKHSKQNSLENKFQKRVSPSKSNSLSNIKLHELKIVLTPIDNSKGYKRALDPLNTKVDSVSNPSQSPRKGIRQKSKQLRRVSKRISGDFSEVLSVANENASVSCESPKGQKWIVSSIDQSSDVCHEKHGESSKKEESKNQIVDSDRIYTPSKNKNTPNKDSPNVFSRVTRRKSNEIMELNTSGNLKIQLSEPAVENIKSPKNISHPIKNALKRKEEEENSENTKPQSSYQSPRLLKKSSINERTSKNSNENILCVDEAGSLSLSSKSLDYVETDHSLKHNPSHESISPMKVSETALKTTTTLTTNDVCTTINDLETCTSSSPKNNLPLKSILCKSVARTLRSNSKDSPIKSVTLKENETVYYKANCNFAENKTDKSAKPKRRKSLTSTCASPQNISLVESKCAETMKSPVIVDFNETEESLSQECEDSNIDRRQVCEKNKENIENQVVANSSFSEWKFEADNACTNSVKRLPILTAYPPLSQKVPEETFNRTLQLYRLSNSESVDVSTSRMVFAEPPLLVPHWEHQPQQQTTSSCTDSPPPLAPHWEQSNCSASATLPESIMAHWQQMSSTVSTSDKIMFDFEDTSYEIKFSPNNEDSTASSICAPFEFPHLIDESKSGFNTIFRKNSTESCGW